VLPDVLAEHLILRAAVQRRRQIRDRAPEARVALRELCITPRPAQIDIPRLLVERVVERPRQSTRARAVHTLSGNPEELALREHHEHPVRAAVRKPVLGFLRDPR
jgi:hypothetical protein